VQSKQGKLNQVESKLLFAKENQKNILKNKETGIDWYRFDSTVVMARARQTPAGDSNNRKHKVCVNSKKRQGWWWVGLSFFFRAKLPDFSNV
jgi:hypothetical protein